MNKHHLYLQMVKAFNEGRDDDYAILKFLYNEAVRAEDYNNQIYVYNKLVEFIYYSQST